MFDAASGDDHDDAEGGGIEDWTKSRGASILHEYEHAPEEYVHGKAKRYMDHEHRAGCGVALGLVLVCVLPSNWLSSSGDSRPVKRTGSQVLKYNPQ